MNAPMKQNKPTSSTRLTRSNYYSNEEDWRTQSKSWFWRFEQCEAEALAALKQDWNPPQNLEPLLMGNDLHTYFESSEAHQQWLDEHKQDVYKYGNPDKGLKASFKQADRMIEALKNDKNFQLLYQGDKEVIVTGELFGVQWRGRIDCLNLEQGLFFDLKTVDDIHKKHWDEQNREYVSFAQSRGYDMQMAVYQQLIKQTFGVECQPLIIAVSKQDIPDKGIFSVPQDLMDDQLQRIKDDQPHIQAVKEGREKPIACGHCAYCRSQKVLNDIINIDDIELY